MSIHEKCCELDLLRAVSSGGCHPLWLSVKLSPVSGGVPHAVWQAFVPSLSLIDKATITVMLLDSAVFW